MLWVYSPAALNGLIPFFVFHQPITVLASRLLMIKHAHDMHAHAYAAQCSGHRLKNVRLGLSRAGLVYFESRHAQIQSS